MRSFKGDILIQIEDTLRHSCLAGSYRYKKILNSDRLKNPRHCKYCKSTDHFRNRCPREDLNDGVGEMDEMVVEEDEVNRGAATALLDLEDNIRLQRDILDHWDEEAPIGSEPESSDADSDSDVRSESDDSAASQESGADTNEKDDLDIYL